MCLLHFVTNYLSFRLSAWLLSCTWANWMTSTSKEAANCRQMKTGSVGFDCIVICLMLLSPKDIITRKDFWSNSPDGSLTSEHRWCCKMLALHEFLLMGF